MPKDIYFWLAAVAAVFALGVLAIWKWAKNVSVAVGPIHFQTSDRDAAASAPDPVVVAKEAEVEGTVGKITGRIGAPDTLPHGPTSVGERMKVGKGGKVDEITGIRVERPKTDR